MILGLGNDLLDMRRIKPLYERHQQRFLDRVYTPLEQEYAFRQKDPIRRLALRFAAKEACAKALGLGLRSGIKMIDMEIRAEENRKPYLTLHNLALQIMHEKTPNGFLSQLDLALSDEPPYVMATVIFSCIRNLPY
ncbi:MAG: holo-ACP synthase [Alphaproteobacteria bacterium]|nr:holo-ACP synthase [Alphaproteobacteria bacterium]